MFCHHCGHKQSITTEFCPECGEPQQVIQDLIKEESSVAVQAIRRYTLTLDELVVLFFVLLSLSFLVVYLGDLFIGWLRQNHSDVLTNGRELFKSIQRLFN